MAKVFHKHGGGAVPAKRTAHLKRISFDPNRNKVRFVRVPPRSQNKHFWFTETQRVVRKGMTFEIEPSINVQISIDCRMQICTLAQMPVNPNEKAVHLSGEAGPSHSPATAVARSVEDRVYLEVKEDLPLFSGPGAKAKWVCVGSVAPGELQRVLLVLPAGSYQVRCLGKRSLQVFAQAWDVEREMK